MNTRIHKFPFIQLTSKSSRSPSHTQNSEPLTGRSGKSRDTHQYSNPRSAAELAGEPPKAHKQAHHPLGAQILLLVSSLSISIYGQWLKTENTVSSPCSYQRKWLQHELPNNHKNTRKRSESWSPGPYFLTAEQGARPSSQSFSLFKVFSSRANTYSQTLYKLARHRVTWLSPLKSKTWVIIRERIQRKN